MAAHVHQSSFLQLQGEKLDTTGNDILLAWKYFPIGAKPAKTTIYRILCFQYHDTTFKDQITLETPAMTVIAYVSKTA